MDTISADIKPVDNPSPEERNDCEGYSKKDIDSTYNKLPAIQREYFEVVKQEGGQS